LKIRRRDGRNCRPLDVGDLRVGCALRNERLNRRRWLQRPCHKMM
jgi:hypothetical protein